MGFGKFKFMYMSIVRSGKTESAFPFCSNRCGVVFAVEKHHNFLLRLEILPNETLETNKKYNNKIKIFERCFC